VPDEKVEHVEILGKKSWGKDDDRDTIDLPPHENPLPIILPDRGNSRSFRHSSGDSCPNVMASIPPSISINVLGSIDESPWEVDWRVRPVIGRPITCSTSVRIASVLRAASTLTTESAWTELKITRDF
jgi:hypothetical protein